MDSTDTIRGKSLEERVDDLEKLYAKLEGAGWLVKVIIYVGVPLGTFIVWIKDFVRT